MPVIKYLCRARVLLVCATFALLVFPQSVFAGEALIYQDDFDDNSFDNVNLTITNYVNRVLGSHANDTYDELFLTLDEISHEIKIEGSAVNHDKLWNGKSVVFQQSINNISSLTVEIKTIVPSVNNIFHTSLFIDFDAENRISFLLGNEGNISENIKLAFFEKGSVRCVGDVDGCGIPPIHYPVFASSPHNMRLKYYPDTDIVEAYIDGVKLIEGVFEGQVSDMQTGFAGMAFERGDFVDLRFDDFKITSTTVETVNRFDLPFDYEGRSNATETQFQEAFWETNRLTAAFDHERAGRYHIPFTGESYGPSDCRRGTVGIECYNGHTGTDFDDRTGENGQNAYSVASGKVIFASPHTSSGDCTPNRGGFGCVVIVQYDNTPSGIVHGLYAHLSQINAAVIPDDFVYNPDSPTNVTEDSILGTVGNTGCVPRCGTHLHFGVMKEVPETTTASNFKKMSKKDWEGLLYQIRPQQTPRARQYCTYRAPNGKRYTFQDPSGWQGTGDDPWNENCGVESHLVWKHDPGTEPEPVTENFFGPVRKFLNL